MKSYRKGRSILFVEDEPDSRALTALAIEKLGYRVVQAASAEEAMNFLRTDRFDVLLTDVTLPGAHGDVLAAEARMLDPTIRLIFATGRRDIPDTTTPGLDPAVLRKPFDIEALEKVLRSDTGSG